MALTRLSLSDFRNHASLSFRPGPKFVVLHGPNGAGKTNILEAVSLLVPGRGLRHAPLGEMVRTGGAGGFGVAAEIEDIKLGTGVEAAAPERRKVRINGASQPVNALAQWLAVVWMTPAMDRLFTDSAGSRRRFLDRLVLALEPSHAAHSSRFEQAVRQRNKLLADERALDAAWLDALEIEMAKSGAAINTNRSAVVDRLSERLAAMDQSPFAVPLIALDSPAIADEAQLAEIWRAARKRDRAAGRTLIGPHRADLIVHHAANGQQAARCSTGEQKALLLSAILAHARLVADLRGEAPIILLDEVAAHLDPLRRMALFERLDKIGSQVWMTGTEAALFTGIGENAQLIEVGNGQIRV
jgi:DNA replication and repair protein RecF